MKVSTVTINNHDLFLCSRNGILEIQDLLAYTPKEMTSRVGLSCHFVADLYAFLRVYGAEGLLDRQE